VRYGGLQRNRRGPRRQGGQRSAAGSGARCSLPPWATAVVATAMGDGGSRTYIRGDGGRPLPPRLSPPPLRPTPPPLLQLCFLSPFRLTRLQGRRRRWRHRMTGDARRQQIHPPDLLTYPREQTHAAARALRLLKKPRRC
jgi:hypothetical protein